ncbi:hypothetical protein OSSY52_04090 [Tepiditoga spiralis]|uniref:ABC transporter permease n=1 Tax=Tepiditoga spiralis TaxID=2108365 RepID=A0A7G1G239_9BACT|nr:ATP-binding cassette domain-containing protein [Tepiditoga spiralis]BBE30268.1 hypothetical protein OSSY52_04090 [Tepiditoga spiralis]
MIFGIGIFILIWYIASLFYNPIILPDPFLTLHTLFNLMMNQSFWIQFFDTLLKSLLGFTLSILIGVPIGFASGINKKFKSFIRPIIMLFQGAPIVSYIAIIMLWFGIGFYTPMFVAFIVIFPTIVLNVSQGIESTDKKLLEMAKVYNIKKSDTIKFIYLGSVFPFIISTLKIVSGTLWKATVVGEFLGGSRGLGYALSISKISLNTDEVFAYTLFLIIVGIIFERLILKINFKLKLPEKKCIEKTREIYKITPASIKIQNLKKSFNTEIISNFSTLIDQSETFAIIGDSGSGKTTILNILSNLIPKTSGTIEKNFKRLAYIFQEDRLIPWMNVEDNIKIVNQNISKEVFVETLKTLKIYDKIKSFPHELSGGMKKRVNIARALIYFPDIILMDEPFSSLDIKIKHEIILDFLKLKEKYKFSIIIVSHDPYELSMLADSTVFLYGTPSISSEKTTYKKAINRNKKENELIYLEIKNKILGEEYEKY